MTRVLVVDDVAAAARTLARLVRTFGMHCETANSADDVLHKRSLERYDVMLLDLVMPGMDGITLCAQLRARGFDGVIIIVSAEDDSGEKARAFDAFADDYLVKPVAGEELERRIRVRLEHRVEVRELRAGQVVSVAPSSSRTPSSPGLTPVTRAPVPISGRIGLLVADPDSTRRAHFLQRFSMSGAVVQEADSREAALEKVVSKDVEAVVLWSRGGAEEDAWALSLVSALRRAAPRTGIIVLSHTFEEPSPEHAQAGADLAFPGGVNAKALWFAVSSLVHGRRERAQILDLGDVKISMIARMVIVNGKERDVGPVAHQLLALVGGVYPGTLSLPILHDLMGYAGEYSSEFSPLKQAFRRVRERLTPFGDILETRGGCRLIHTSQLCRKSDTMPKVDRGAEPAEPDARQTSKSKPKSKRPAGKPKKQRE
ncbi:MAG: response regulator [Polyangiaceae bacterium]|nr:response regulator [Polyangiaceae bacterium]